ncbi:MAG TPA: glutamyl-tRNA reductase [Oligoflexia bacterium]|nr:glutamyl-tRNA reductase [Oligoflexia bacterium]
MSFKTADLAFREAFSSEEKLKQFIEQQIKQKNIKGAFSLSTCNRVEICYEKEESKESILEELIKFFNVDKNKIESDKVFYFKKEEEVIKHVFKVASSLDSLVIGEPQITAQLKKSYQQAHEHNLVSGQMHKFIHKALSVSKKIKSDTNIGKHAVSISYVAVELIKKVFEDLKQCKVLLLGAGEMAELCLKHLQVKEIKNISIANRSLEKAISLSSQYDASTIAFDQYKKMMHKFDIIIASTAADSFIVEYNDMKEVMTKRKNKPVFIIDISVPRNVNPNVEDFGEVYLYNVDDLEKISVNNKKIRYDEALKADLIISEEVNKFIDMQEQEANKESIVELRKKYEDIFSYEIKKMLKSLKSIEMEDLEKIEKTFEAVQKKVLANPIKYVKSKPSKEKILELRKIFNINND